MEETFGCRRIEALESAEVDHKESTLGCWQGTVPIDLCTCIWLTMQRSLLSIALLTNEVLNWDCRKNVVWSVRPTVFQRK